MVGGYPLFILSLSLLAKMAIRMIWAKIFLVYGALYAMFVQCSSSLDVIGNVATAKRNWRDTSRSHRQPISTVMYRVSQKGPGRIPTVGKMLALVLLCMLSQSKCRHSLHRRSHVVVKIEMFGIPHVCIQRRTTHTAHVHFGKNISKFSMTGGEVIKPAGQNGSREKRGQFLWACGPVVSSLWGCYMAEK